MAGFGKRFNIIRHAGEVNSATTAYGTRVHRQEKIFFPQKGWQRFVKCCSYDNHFIFEEKKHLGWTTFCTCGSPAVIVGYGVYKKDASPTTGGGIIPGEMLICLHHAQMGKHLDGSE